MPGSNDAEKKPKKQDGTLGRGTQAAIWTAFIAAAGTFATTGIPRIIELFSSRPAIETVQDMLAEQADKLTEATNRNVDAIEKLNALVEQQQHELAKLDGMTDTMKDMVLNCCSRSERYRMRPRPTTAPKSSAAKSPRKKGDEEKTTPVEKEAAKVLKEKVELMRVDKMERPWVQQQVQVQTAEEK